MAEEILDVDDARRLEKVANKVDAVTDRIKAVLDTMSTEHSARYGCWGADKTGDEFAKGYLNGMKKQQEVIKSYPEFLSGEKGYSPEFRKVATLLTAVERGNEDGFKRTVRFKA